MPRATRASSRYHCQNRRFTLIHPFENEDVMAGQGTVRSALGTSEKSTTSTFVFVSSRRSVVLLAGTRCDAQQRNHTDRWDQGDRR